MAEAFYLGAYWGDRKEDVESCSIQLSEFLLRLAGVHEWLSGWYRRGRGELESRLVGTSPGVLRESLLAGRNRTDAGNKVIADLGYSVSWWNENRSAPVSLSVQCGLHAGVAGLLNSVVLDFPEPDEGSGLELYRPGLFLAALNVVVEAWNPDWAVVTPRSLRNAQDYGDREPFIGWMTYFSAPRRIPEGLPSGVTRERLPSGTVLCLSQEVDVAPLETALALRKSLTRANALFPTPQG